MSTVGLCEKDVLYRLIVVNELLLDTLNRVEAFVHEGVYFWYFKRLSIAFFAVDAYVALISSLENRCFLFSNEKQWSLFSYKLLVC